MKPSDLKKMIQEIVSQEVRRQLPPLVARVLAEQYMRKIISESVGLVRDDKGPVVKPSSAPHPNGTPRLVDALGLGRQSEEEREDGRATAASSVAVSARPPGLKFADPMVAHLLEGVKPLPADSRPDADIPLEALDAIGVDFAAVARTAQKMETARVSRGPIPVPEEIRKISQQREPQPRLPSAPRSMHPASVLSEMGVDGGFPDRPIVLEG